MNNLKSKKYLFLAIILVVFSSTLAACGADVSAPTPVAAQATATPSQTPVQTTAAVTTVAATATAIPTATPIPPTSTPVPTATPVPPTSTPLPTATPVPPTPTTAPTSTPLPAATPVPPTATPTPLNASGYPGKIVFDTADKQIFMIYPDGSGRKKLANGTSPLFSPDGQRVAFLSRQNKADGSSKVTIASVNLDGTDRQEYCEVANNAYVTLVRWSPRSRFIAVNTTQNGPGIISLCSVADKQMHTVETVLGHASLIFDWTPDGENAIYQSGNYDDLEIFYGDPDKNGTDATEISPGYNYRFDINDFQYYPAARISPDGNTVAVVGGGIVFTNVPGKLSSLSGQNYVGAEVSNVAWSPDGRALAVISRGLPSNAAPTVLQLVALDKKGAGKPTIHIENNLGGSLDWSRQ